MEELIEQYRQGRLTRQELETGLKSYWEGLDANSAEVRSYARPEMIEAILNEAKGKAAAPVIEISVWKKVARYAAVAATVAAIVFGLKQIINTGSNITQQITAKADVKAPVTNRAMITLGDGRTVYLDSAGNGQLASEAGMNLVKLGDGQIAYQGNTETVQYNTLTNPRGSKVIDITLADGSRIWLNAGSSLRYPTAFTGATRNVTIEGEGYFQVAHNDKIPFIASANGTEVKVYGTEFNLRAYKDDRELKVTLLKGSVGVTHNAQQQMLKPNEQAIVAGNIILNQNVDTEDVIAWKDGVFTFHDQSVADIMKQAARWYDVEVVMEGNPTQGFTILNASRATPISNLLKSMETSGGVHFEINEKKIIVKP
jgi:transmembrane sensor